MTKRKPGAKIGRPKAEIDLRVLRRLAQHQSTMEEMAAVLGIARSTFFARLESDPAIRTVIEEGRESGKQALRGKQYAVAMKGETKMLQWLGKQYLGQRDTAHVEAEVKVTDARETLDSKLARLAERLPEANVHPDADTEGS